MGSFMRLTGIGRACSGLAFGTIVVGSLLLGGCATPARPSAASSQRALELNSQPLDGDYEVSISARFFGPLRTRMKAEALAESAGSASAPPPLARFKGNTTPGVAWNLIGGMPGALGPVMMPFIFPSGMLLYWESDVPRGTEPGLGKIGPSTLSSLQATTRYYGPDRPVEMSVENSGTIVVMEVRKLSESEAAQPFAKPDYTALVDAYAKVFGEMTGLKGGADAKAFEKYAGSLRTAAGKAKDDVEFIFALVLAWRDQKEFPMPAIFRRVDREAERKLFARTQGEQQPLKFTRDEASGIVTVEVTAFIDPEQVDKVMKEALATKPKGVVLDLSNCTGFESAAFRVASWLRDQPTAIGILYPKEVEPSEISPKPNSYTISSLGRAKDLDAAVDKAAQRTATSAGQPLALIADPEANAFDGPIAVVVSSRTASTAEMLAHALGAAGAPVVGETTAKRPTLAREIDLNVPGAEEWIARIPRYDYVGPKGEFIKLTGVRPTHSASKDQAVKLAKELVLQGTKVEPTKAGSRGPTVPAPDLYY
ncbi:MAG: hypothetical protein KGS45_04065 [Planctomycetes bacterium]|nr:hypothetical protein [Planctomycetota bacterium]